MTSIQSITLDDKSTESESGDFVVGTQGQGNEKVDISCFHCGLPILDKQYFEGEIAGKVCQFCCPACEMVCRAIYDADLQGFYDRTPAGGKLAPPPATPKDLALYDLDEVQAEFVGSLGKERDIHLLVEGIHCAACVWLIEHSLRQLPGLLDARVNLSAKRLLLRWDNEQLKLSRIIEHLAAMGYAAVPYDPEIAERRLEKQNRALLLRMAFAGFAMMNLLWISIALYTGAAEGGFRNLFHWVGFCLATPTLFYSGYPFLHSAWTGLRRLHLTMDLPIAIGAISTYSYSVYITLSQSVVGAVYYDTVVNFLFVILIGRYLEAMTKRQAISSTQRLLDLQPRGATVIRDDEQIALPIGAVKKGDVVLIKSGDKIPVDGKVLEGRSSVDESMLSGEARLVTKSEHEKVFSGTMNIGGPLRVIVEGTLRDTSLGRIIHLVENAQASKAPIQRVADAIVPWFVAVTLLLAIFTFFFWLGVSFEMALMASTAVLIITCPCAFGLATPMSIASASGLAARQGILIKNGGVLEVLSKVDHIIFDKTGTLTKGQLQVQKVICTDDISEQTLLSVVAALERYSEHNIAKTLVKYVDKKDLLPYKVRDFESQPGLGIKAVIDQQRILIGTRTWLTQHNVKSNADFQYFVSEFEDQGTSCVHVAYDDREVGIIALSDQLRSDAKALVASIRKWGVKMTLLTGDRQPVADAIALQLGGMDTIAEVLPEDKDKVIQELQTAGAIVAMVGDGVNDALALVRADVGIALGSGTDISGDSADIVLMTNELEKVQVAIQLSARTLRTVRQNIGISVIYNIVMVPLAMAGLITPLIAAISMPISSLLVIGNAIRIRTIFK